MLSNIGFPTLILIIVIVLLLFGPNKLPELGRAFGKMLHEFKNGAKDMMSDEEESEQKQRKEVEPQVQQAQAAARGTTNAERKDDRRLPD